MIYGERVRGRKLGCVCWCLLVVEVFEELALGSEASDVDRAFAVTPISFSQSPVTKDDCYTSFSDPSIFVETFG
jgi:hypothetical protein